MSDEMERARAARAILVDCRNPPSRDEGRAARERRERGELEAFMAIFHPGHEVPVAEHVTTEGETP